MEDSYSDSLNKILQSARGRLSEIEEFSIPDDASQDENSTDLEILTPEDSELSTESSENEISEINQPETTDERSKLRRLAALMAVMTMESKEDSRGDVGRQLGSAWAQDHRRQTMGLSGFARSKAKRATWR